MKKIISYIGFAIKARKVVFGQSRLKHLNEKLYLILLGSSASENLIDLGKNLSKKHDCEMIVCGCELSTLTNVDGVKIIGITDENLSNAIINNKEKLTIG